MDKFHDQFFYGPKGGFCGLAIIGMSIVKLSKTIGKCTLTNVILWNDSLEFRAHEISKFIVSILPSTYGRAQASIVPSLVDVGF